MKSFADLPLFATDAEIGAALLGPKRAKEWAALATLQETRGLPPIDELMGGRYTPAVKAYFDQRYGLAATPPTRPDGMEGEWKTIAVNQKHRVLNLDNGQPLPISPTGSRPVKR